MRARSSPAAPSGLWTSADRLHEVRANLTRPALVGRRKALRLAIGRGRVRRPLREPMRFDSHGPRLNAWESRGGPELCLGEPDAMQWLDLGSGMKCASSSLGFLLLRQVGADAQVNLAGIRHRNCHHPRIEQSRWRARRHRRVGRGVGPLFRSPAGSPSGPPAGLRAAARHRCIAA